VQDIDRTWRCRIDRLFEQVNIRLVIIGFSRDLAEIKEGSDCKIFERWIILSETWARVTWGNLLLIIDFY
jgi:hypothetical protein